MKMLLIIIEKTNTGFSAYVPDLPGCIASGETKGETEQNMAEAIRFHIEGMELEGLPIPDSSTESEMMVLV